MTWQWLVWSFNKGSTLWEKNQTTWHSPSPTWSELQEGWWWNLWAWALQVEETQHSYYCCNLLSFLRCIKVAKIYQILHLSVFLALTFERSKFQGHLGKVAMFSKLEVKCHRFIFGANISNIPETSSATGFICEKCSPNERSWVPLLFEFNKTPWRFLRRDKICWQKM